MTRIEFKEFGETDMALVITDDAVVIYHLENLPMDSMAEMDWYPDFPGDRPPKRYGIYKDGVLEREFSASGDSCVSPYEDAYEQFVHYVNKENK